MKLINILKEIKIINHKIDLKPHKQNIKNHYITTISNTEIACFKDPNSDRIVINGFKDPKHPPLIKDFLEQNKIEHSIENDLPIFYVNREYFNFPENDF